MEHWNLCKKLDQFGGKRTNIVRLLIKDDLEIEPPTLQVHFDFRHTFDISGCYLFCRTLLTPRLLQLPSVRTHEFKDGFWRTSSPNPLGQWSVVTSCPFPETGVNIVNHPWVRVPLFKSTFTVVSVVLNESRPVFSPLNRGGSEQMRISFTPLVRFTVTSLCQNLSLE